MKQQRFNWTYHNYKQHIMICEIRTLLLNLNTLMIVIRGEMENEVNKPPCHMCWKLNHLLEAKIHDIPEDRVFFGCFKAQIEVSNDVAFLIPIKKLQYISFKICCWGTFWSVDVDYICKLWRYLCHLILITLNIPYPSIIRSEVCCYPLSPTNAIKMLWKPFNLKLICHMSIQPCLLQTYCFSVSNCWRWY